VSISARDQARIGKMLLEGRRGARQPVIACRWIEAMGEPCPVAPFYGQLVWLNRDRDEQAFPCASPQVMFMLGAGGHTVWVDPGLDSVVVLRWPDPTHAATVIRRIAAALAGG